MLGCSKDFMELFNHESINKYKNTKKLYFIWQICKDALIS